MSRESFEKNIRKNYAGFDKIRVKDRDAVLDLLSYIDSKAPKKNAKKYIEKALNFIITEQEKGKEPKKIVGKNYKEFADGLMGVKAKSVRIDLIDMAIITAAMIPFFLAINCLMGIRTLNYGELQATTYNLTITPIITALLIMPMIYMFFYYLAYNKKGYNKLNFLVYVIGELIWIIVLNFGAAHLNGRTLVHIHGYAILAIGSVIIILTYLVRINGFIKGRLS